MQVTVELPDSVAEQIRASTPDIARRMLEALAIEGYRSGTLTGKQVREMLGLKSRFDLDPFLKRAGVFREYTAEELESDFQASREAHYIPHS
ncbi:MAG TPA: UPF0175 family protein [Bryobacteraceae bacterium]|nr:UPF0175 family protein [Bryobacteraceae bacterium]